LSALDSSQQVADIGCGSGEFLRCCRAAGVPATGFDFSRTAVMSCRDGGLDARILSGVDSGNDGGVAGVDGPVTCATAFHVLEHLSEPARLFRIVASISSRIDKLFVSVPSDRRPSRFFGEVDLLDQPPHHLTRWTPAALREFARSAGWRMASFQYEPLSLRADLWHRAIRMRPYKSFAVDGRASWAERSLRYLLYPSALIARMAGNCGMSGFSMLGRFDRV
jgi:SAM-dependent methyltransferase